jgi:hypothetical protein
MPGFVDPRPHLEAELRAKQAELAGAADDDQRTRIEGEIRELERSLGRGGGWRRLLFGFGHRRVPW